MQLNMNDDITQRHRGVEGLAWRAGAGILSTTFYLGARVRRRRICNSRNYCFLSAKLSA